MENPIRIGRRAACATVFGIGGSLLMTGGAVAQRRRTPAAQPPLSFKNSDFYDAQGKFNVEAAKEAYFTLMKAAGYPISENLRKNIFVTDYGLGQFTVLGLAAMFWVNDKKWNYTSTEVFLLPNQMIPEHWHVPLEAEGVATKMESWCVRWGQTFTYGEGEPTPQISVKVPESEAKYVTVRHEVPLKVGEVTGVTKPGEKHWQLAGPQGCILTETSTYHAGAAVKFANPAIKF
jgi:D-lyxose ketol-isomerase